MEHLCAKYFNATFNILSSRYCCSFLSTVVTKAYKVKLFAQI